MPDHPSGNSTRRVEAIRGPILIFVRNNELITEQRETCPRCDSTWDTWMCYDTIEETRNFAIQCRCGLRFEQVSEHPAEGAGDDHAD